MFCFYASLLVFYGRLLVSRGPFRPALLLLYLFMSLFYAFWANKDVCVYVCKIYCYFMLLLQRLIVTVHLY